ncbi:hypothetical protein ACFV0R_16690 [Streptomyces sp. NPDC059578]|uniref:hypothetical protein n=1 Tax=Streptomyces sp. NPDC059578 TaxID=3346874 RepID=UPI0036B9E673
MPMFFQLAGRDTCPSIVPSTARLVAHSICRGFGWNACFCGLPRSTAQVRSDSGSAMFVSATLSALLSAPARLPPRAGERF